MLEPWPQNYGLEQLPTFTDLGEAIGETAANLVFDVTVPQAHPTITRAALEGGCDVLGEKPMAASMQQARAMVSLAHSTGKTYAVMQNRRYLEPIRAFRSLVTGGTLGRPGFATAEFFVGAHFGGFRDAMQSPLLLDMAIHTFDQARFITGKDPISVYCHEFNPAGSWYSANAAAVCIFEFEGGLVFTCNGSWCAEGRADLLGSVLAGDGQPGHRPMERCERTLRRGGRRPRTGKLFA